MARSLVVKVTAGADAPERCNQAFTVAATALASGASVSLWLTGESAWFALPGRAAEFELPHEVDHLRFDPSRAPCTFTCNALEVERTRHVESLLQGVRSIARKALGKRDPGATPEMLRSWEERGYLTLPGFYSGAELEGAIVAGLCRVTRLEASRERM